MTTQSNLIEALRTRPAVTVDEAALIYSVSRGTIYNRIREGSLKAVRYGRRLSIPTAQIREELDVPAYATP